MADIEVVLDAGAVLGEAPSWSVAAQELLWVDIEGRRFHRHSAAMDWSMELPWRPGAVVERENPHEYVFAAEHGFYAVSVDSGDVSLLADISKTELPSSRLNDGKCDPAGRFWAGTFTGIDGEPVGHLYRFDPDLMTHVLLDGVRLSNGLGWSPDAKSMYYIDTMKRTVDIFDFDIEIGTIRNRRTLVDLTISKDGLPDGLTVDADGGIWIAMARGCTVQRYLPDGTPDRTIELPVRGVTSCTFGGRDLGDLYITTNSRTAPGPLAGALFVTRPGVTGLAATTFAG